MPILDVVHLKAFIIRPDHASIRNQKAGDKADGKRHQKEEDDVLSGLVPQLAQEPFPQGISHVPSPPLPLEILDGDPEETAEYEEFQGLFFLMKELADILEEKRAMRGAIGFDFPESEIALDATRCPNCTSELSKIAEEALS